MDFCNSNGQEHQVRAAAERVGEEAPAEFREIPRRHLQRGSRREGEVANHKLSSRIVD
jgi:hypothetical protein